MSIVWNTETGVVITIVWAISKSIVESRGQDVICLVKCGIKYIFGGVILFVGAWQVVSFFNKVLLKGDLLSFRQFIYPLGTSFVAGISQRVVWSNLLWIIVLGILIACFIYAFRNIIAKNSDKDIEVMMSIALMGIMLFPYYYNRAAYVNLFMVSWFQVIILGTLICKKMKMKNIYFIGIFLASVFSVNSLMFAVPIKSIRKSGDMKFVLELKEKMEIEIPDDTVFYGEGSSYYSLLFDGTTALPYNSVNFIMEGLAKTREFFNDANQNIVIIRGDEFVDGMMSYWIGITKEDL